MWMRFRYLKVAFQNRQKELFRKPVQWKWPPPPRPPRRNRARPPSSTGWTGAGARGLGLGTGPGGDGSRLGRAHDLAVAADRTAPGPGGEARSLHRQGAGARRPQHEPGRVAWLLIYPDTYEIGLPNQGLQILYEILNERPDAVAERAYAPWTDMEAAMRAAAVPLFCVDSTWRRGDFDVLAFNLSAELVYTNLLNLVDLAGVPVRNADRGAVAPARGGGRSLRLQPRAAGRLRRRVRDRRRRRGRGRDHRRDRRVAGRGRRPAASDLLRALADGAGRVRALVYERSYERAPDRRWRPARRRSRAGREAHGRGPGRLALSEASARPARSRSCTTGSTSRSSGAAPGAVASARRA